MWLWLITGCRSGDTDVPARDRGDDTELDVTAITADTGPDGTTGATGTTAETGDTAMVPPECRELASTPVSLTEYPIETTEDFDFDADGRLLYVDWSGNLIAALPSGQRSVVSPGQSWDTDARGVQVLSTGEVVICYISGNRIVKVDPATGVRTDLIVGISGPNALEVGDGDVLYFTETGTGRVGQYDPLTDTSTVIASGFRYPNGLALSPDQLTLYVSDDTWGIYRIERATRTDAWGPRSRVFDPARGEAYDAMETDVCGNLYAAQFYSGKIYRYDVVRGGAALIVDLNDPTGFLWNAMRWGSNRGEWRRDTLYVTSRSKVFGVELGVDGRPQPVDLVP